MNLLLWKEELVQDYDTALERARAGAAYLDGRFGPMWDRRIDVETLDIASPVRCVLAQLYLSGHFCLPTPRRAVDCGFSCGLFSDVFVLLRIPRFVRAYALLSQAWKAVLDQRRQPVEEPTAQVESAPVNRVFPSRRPSLRDDKDRRRSTVSTPAGRSKRFRSISRLN